MRRYPAAVARERAIDSRETAMPARSTDAADYQRVPRPVAAMPKTFSAGDTTGWHTHERAQLLFAARGAMSVDVPGSRWIVPPTRALWIPAGTPHEVAMRGRVEMRTLYLRPSRGDRLPRECAAYETTPLLRELIARAVEAPVLYDLRGIDGLVMRLLRAELARLPSMPLSLPVPHDGPLAALCARLLDDPGDGADLAAHARALGVAERTFARRFVAQTGLSFGRWRARARVLDATRRLADGESVTSVALSMGYDSPSAFGAMFRRATGVVPSEVARRDS